jgi:hypothetical protein
MLCRFLLLLLSLHGYKIVHLAILLQGSVGVVEKELDLLEQHNAMLRRPPEVRERVQCISSVDTYQSNIILNQPQSGAGENRHL